MNGPTAVVVVAALAIAGAIAWMYLRRRRTDQLRDRFGPEYERELHERGSRRKAEAELAERARRVKKMEIQPLPPGERVRYASMWTEQQARFVDDPHGAVEQADHLVEEVMARRGYPISDFDQQAADLSVEVPQVIENYRAAHAIAVRREQGQAGTEDLRKAMVYYRTLFEAPAH